MSKVRINIPASTTNLGPGFDVLGMALKLYNTIEMEESRSGLNIEVEGEGEKILSRDETNLVYQSSKAIFDKIGGKIPPLNIKLINSIPLARGLGSSGTAIIGGLMGANAISGAGLSYEDILNIAADIDGHPDNVAASIFGGLVIASSTENGIAYMKIIPPRTLSVVAVVPDFHLFTTDARAILPASVDLKTAVFNISRSSLLVAAMATGDFRHLGISMEDRLHQPYRAMLIPGIDDVFKAAKNENAAVAISGAGSSIVAFCHSDNGREVGEKMRQAFLKHSVNSHVMMLDIDEKGTELQYE